jgi:hypothetical protein
MFFDNCPSNRCCSKEIIIKQIKILEDLEVKTILESDTVTLKKIWSDD